MPSRKVHNYVAKLLGINEKLANTINKDIDRPAKWLGKKHRILFHDFDLSTYLLLAKYKFNSKAILAWYAHKLVDEIAKDKNMRRLFELLEKIL